MKQVKIKDIDNNIFIGGIELDNGDIICACCGGLIEKDDLGEAFEIVEKYDVWIDFSETIIH